MTGDDEGLTLSGPSAGRWDAIGLTVIVAALIALPIITIVAGVTNWPPVFNAIFAPAFVAALFAGLALRFLALGKFRREAAAGYSTLQDIAGLTLRDSMTGAVIREAHEPVAEWSKISWFRSARRFDRYKLSR